MKDELYNLYVEQSRFKSLPKKIKKALIVFFTLDLIYIIVWFFLMFKDSNIKISIIFAIIFLLSNISFMKILDSRTALIIKQYQYDREIAMIDKLKSYGLYNLKEAERSADKLEVLIKAYAKDAEGKKIKFPIFPSMFAALLVSEFNGIINYLLKYDYLKESSIGFVFFVAVFILIVVLFFMYIMLKPFFCALLNSEYEKLLNFSKYLENIKNRLILNNDSVAHLIIEDINIFQK